MADKIIAASLKLDTGGATQEMKNFDKATEDASKSLGKTNDEAKESTGAFTNLKGGLSQIPGPLKQVTGGIETVNTSLKALAANPIVLVITLLVAALVALYKAFASTEAGAEKIEQIMSGLGAVITVIRDRVLKFASAIVSFFKGDFKKAVEEAKDSVSGFGDEVVSAYNRAADATRRLQEAQDDLARRINVNRAELDRDLAKSRELITDTTASYKDRVKALNEVDAAQKKQAADELANAKEMLAIKQEQYNLDKNSSDAADELAAAKIHLANVEQQAAADERNINKQRNAIEADRAAKSKEYADAEKQRINEQIAKEKELLEERKQRALDWNKFVQQQAEDRMQKRKEQEEQDKKDQEERDKYQQEQDENLWATTQAAMKMQTAAMKKEEEERYKINVQFKKLARIADSQQVAAIQNTANTLSELFGKQTVAGKAFAIVSTTIDTYKSAVSAYAGMVSAFPGPVGIAAGVVAAAASVALGIKNIQKIASVKVPGHGDAGGSVPSADSFASPAAPVAPQQVGTTIDQSSIQGIGNAAVGRTYVLSQDIEHDQNRSERLNRAARLGG